MEKNRSMKNKLLKILGLVMTLSMIASFMVPLLRFLLRAIPIPRFTTVGKCQPARSGSDTDIGAHGNRPMTAPFLSAFMMTMLIPIACTSQPIGYTWDDTCLMDLDEQITAIEPSAIIPRTRRFM
jgi:hypothetical protein